MGVTLTNKTINSTYQGLLKFSGNGVVTPSYQIITDGFGNDSSFQLSTLGIKTTGVIEFTDATSNVFSANSSTGEVLAPLSTIGIIDAAAASVLVTKEWANNAISGSGFVTSALPITTEAIVLGDDGAKGVKESIVTISSNGNVEAVRDLAAESINAQVANSSTLGIGFNAMKSDVGGNLSTGVGYQALEYNSTGNSNTGFGALTMNNVTTNNNNSAFGTYALWKLLTGDNNTAIGAKAGRFYGATSELYNVADSIFIGANVKASGDGITNEIAIGVDAVGQGSNTVYIGNSSTTDTFLTGEITANGSTIAGINAIGNKALVSKEWIDGEGFITGFEGYFESGTDAGGDTISNLGWLSSASSQRITVDQALGTIKIGAGLTVDTTVMYSGYKVGSGVYDTPLGTYSLTIGVASDGEEMLNSGTASILVGRDLSSGSQGIYNAGFGTGHNMGTASGDSSQFAAGYYNVVVGQAAAAIGKSLITRSGAELAVGLWNTDYTRTASEAFGIDAADRAFIVGVGTSSGNRKDGLIVLKGGEVSIPEQTTAKINAIGAKAVITKEYADANYVDGAVDSVFGRTGVVVATSGDYDADEITETATRVFVTPTEKANFNTAYGWGDHSGAGYSTDIHANIAALDLVSGTNTGDQDLSGYQLLSGKDAINGYAGLDGSGLINPSQLPALAISTTYVVATEIAQLALTVQEGDVAVRSDQNKSYIALNSDNVNMADWQELLSPTSDVISVFGRTGAVTAQSGDYTADQITETASRVFISPTQETNFTTAFGWGDHSGLYATVSHTHTFASLTSKPTTIAGYGITDFVSLGDAEWAQLSHTHTFASLTSKPTTLSGYGITGTKTNFNAALSNGSFMYVGDAPTAHTHTFASLTSKPTTIGGYGITDFNALGDARWSLTSHNHSGVYEPVFSKNTGFNKNFGTAAGTVAQGNDSRITNGQTAFGWGDHSVAGYGTGTVTSVGTNTGLSGTVTGSGNLSLALQNLTDMTVATEETDELIILDNGVQKRKAFEEIGLSMFSNDVGFATVGQLYSSPLTTKGDIFTRSSSSDSRLPIGTNGQILEADSAQPLGMKWVTPAGGAGDVTASANLGDNFLIRGDGNGKGVQNSGITVTDGDAITGVDSIGISNTGSLYFGYLSGSSVTSATNNVCIGSFAGQDITTASDSIFIGVNAGANVTTGTKSIGIGKNALDACTTGGYNIAIGDNSLSAQTTGFGYNTCVGYESGLLSTTGNANTYMGHRAGREGSTGYGNVSIGFQAGQKFTGLSTNNVVVGRGGAENATSGSSNVVMGMYSGAKDEGNANVTGMNTCTLIGYYAKLKNSTGDSNSMVLGNAAIGKGDNTAVYGNASILSHHFEAGYVEAEEFKLTALNTAPSSASDTGTTGEIRWDANYMYVCTATNTWKRVAVATW